MDWLDDGGEPEDDQLIKQLHAKGVAWLGPYFIIGPNNRHTVKRFKFGAFMKLDIDPKTLDELSAQLAKKELRPPVLKGKELLETLIDEWHVYGTQLASFGKFEVTNSSALKGVIARLKIVEQYPDQLRNTCELYIRLVEMPHFKVELFQEMAKIFAIKDTTIREAVVSYINSFPDMLHFSLDFKQIVEVTSS